jgi:hypothetical protein
MIQKNIQISRKKYKEQCSIYHSFDIIYILSSKGEGQRAFRCARQGPWRLEWCSWRLSWRLSRRLSCASARRRSGSAVGWPRRPLEWSRWSLVKEESHTVAEPYLVLIDCSIVECRVTHSTFVQVLMFFFNLPADGVNTSTDGRFF